MQLAYASEMYSNSTEQIIFIYGSVRYCQPTIKTPTFVGHYSLRQVGTQKETSAKFNTK